MIYKFYCKEHKATLFLMVFTVLSFSRSYSQVKPNAGATVSAKSGTVLVVTPGTYPNNAPVNYIRAWEPQQPYISADEVGKTTRQAQEVTHETQYFDGLGRSLQTVGWQSSPGKKDIVATHVYDEFGREQYQYLPYASTTNNGLLKANPFIDQKSFYSTAYPLEQPALKNESFYYGHTVYEPSPLNRTIKTFAPGNSWEGSEIVANVASRTAAEKAASVQYLINNSNDHVRIWDITFDPVNDNNNIPKSGAEYDGGLNGQLQKTVTLDEHSNAVVEYKDNEGHVILKKVQIGTIATDFGGYSGFLCTYYVYDDFGQLRFVIPPKAVAKIIATWTVSPEIASELCFRYEYDARQRMIAKKVPGAAWVYMVYDSRDRLVFTQDGNLRLKSPEQWAYTVYDDINRPVETGIMKYSGTWSTLITAAANAVNTTPAVSTAGTLVNTLPVDLPVSDRDYTVNPYNATNSITFQDGFMSEDGADFKAEIVSASNPAFTASEWGNMKAALGSDAIYYPLTYTYYDNYGFGTSKTYSTVNNSKLNDGGGNIAATLESLPTTASTSTRSMATGVRVRVIEDPNDLTKGYWLETVTYYDDKGRPVQVQADNYKGGKDISTNRYNFTGKVVASYLVHTNPAAGKDAANNIGVKSGILYDHAGRITKTSKQVTYQGVTYTRTTALNTYDALGQLKNKQTGQKSAADTTPMESDNYTYNIRGWIKGVNWYTGTTYASQVSNSSNKWFGFDLSYDWGMSASLQYNGNISGQRWKSAGDSKERAFGYSYDMANRLLKADFTQNNGSWGSDPMLNFNVVMGTGTASSAYDENGNIKAMQQYGLKGTGSVLIDNFTYKYNGTGQLGNKLLQTTEDNTIAATDNSLGDFTDRNRTGDDYSYDVNGNLVRDKNKYIQSITYNHLNLPYRIVVNTDNSSNIVKGTITYIYDALGNKLEKRTDENAIAANNNVAKQTQTAYLNGFIYENNKLQFFGHEEGRIRFKQTIDAANQPRTEFVFDYFLKDHLGNVRMVLTDELKQDVYPAATLEGNMNISGFPNAVNIERAYYTIDSTNIADRSSDYVNSNAGVVNNNPYSNTTANSTKMYLLKASGTAGATGLGITLKVMSGDKIDILGKSYWNSQTTGGNDSKGILVDDIIAAMLGTPTGATTGKGITAATLSNGASNIPPTFVSQSVPATDLTPNAWINWIQLDEQFRYVSSGASRVNAAAGIYTHDDLRNIAIAKNGYIYVYCSNQSPVNVYFDNLQVVHTRGPLLEETHYYPFGLTMAGISSKAAGILPNKYKFGGKEFQSNEFSDNSGLEEYDFGARSYDPQIGRWHKTDGKSELYFATSPYVYALNQPTNAVDPDGNIVIFINGNHYCLSPPGASYWRYTETKWDGTYVQNGNATWNWQSPHMVTTTYKFDMAVMQQLGDNYKPRYYDGSVGGWHPIADKGRPSANAEGRYNYGYEQGKIDAKTIINNLARDKSGNIIETIKVITHSMGGAYGKGFVQALQDYIKTLPVGLQKQIKISLVADFDPYQAGSLTADHSIFTKQFKHAGAYWWDNIAGMGWLANEDEQGLSKEDIKTNTGTSTNHSIFTFFNEISSLQEGTYKWDDVSKTWVRQ